MPNATTKELIAQVREAIPEVPVDLWAAFSKIVKARAALDALAALLQEREDRIGKMKAMLRDVIGDHHAPNDCYATGPMTGDPFYDLVRCPACCALKYLETPNE